MCTYIHIHIKCVCINLRATKQHKKKFISCDQHALKITNKSLGLINGILPILKMDVGISKTH